MAQSSRAVINHMIINRANARRTMLIDALLMVLVSVRMLVQGR
jgi:hypothetical protein